MSDFNRDGFADLVVGIPGESPGDDPESGAIAVLLGSANGLVANGTFDQENLGLGNNESGDSFGFSLAIGDFNNDNFADLVVGIPGESPGNDPISGAIAVLQGSNSGLVPSGSFDQENLGLGNNEFGDLFGDALAVGDFNNDGFDDLVVGSPREAPGGDPPSGVITLLNGSSNGLVPNSTFEQENLGLGNNEFGDLFGDALAVGDFNNDGFDDLVVGIPGEAPGGDSPSGAIAVLLGSTSGLVPNSTFDQENLGLGNNEFGDSFGDALAVGDFNNDGFDDLVVGSPLEGPGDDSESGVITILNGSSNGLVPNSTFDQENLGLGSNEFGDLFGDALAVGDFNNDGFDDLVVGIPGEGPGNDPQSGAIAVLEGSADGLVPSESFNQENLGLGSNEFGDLFGSSLSAGDYNNDGFDDLTIGIPGESPGDDPQSGAIVVLEGSANGLVPSEEFNQENLGLGNNESGDLFGFSLASTSSDDDVDPDPGDEGTIELYRFRNTTFSTGTYIFVGRQERDNILNNPDFSNVFELEGDGNVAFVASTTGGENYEAFYRLRSLDVPGTYLFVGREEYDAIFADDSEQRDRWVQEGRDNNDVDIPEFYVFGVGANQGLPFNRFQNNFNNTFLFAGPNESAIIRNDPNLSATFTDQGGAFEAII